MRIINAKFVKSVATREILNELPEFAFCGRSNVGKSSLINALCNHNNLARVSSVPGKTRLINYFAINNNTFYFVDLPGYGYHKAGYYYDNQWANTLEYYILKSKKLKLCFLLMDLNVPPSAEDKEMIKFLSFNLIPFVIIGTKADKMSKSQLYNAVLKLASNTNVGTADIIPVSSRKKMNLDKIVEVIDKYLAE